MLLPQTTYCSEGVAILDPSHEYKNDDYDDGGDDDDEDDDHDDGDDRDDCKCGATSGLGRTSLNTLFKDSLLFHIISFTLFYFYFICLDIGGGKALHRRPWRCPWRHCALRVRFFSAWHTNWKQSPWANGLVCPQGSQGMLNKPDSNHPESHKELHWDRQQNRKMLRGSLENEDRSGWHGKPRGVVIGLCRDHAAKAYAVHRQHCHNLGEGQTKA